MLYCIDIGVLQPKKYIVKYKCIASLQVYISILVVCSKGFSMVLRSMPFLVWFFFVKSEFLKPSKNHDFKKPCFFFHGFFHGFYYGFFC